MTETQYLVIKHGPCFSGLYSTLGIIGTVASAVTFLLLLQIDALILAVIMIPAFAIFVAMFLDYQGVEIYFDQNKIRQYRSLLGYKYGTWETFNDFNLIELRCITIKWRTATGWLTSSRNYASSDSYFVHLVGDSDLPPLEIGEYATHQGAKKTMALLNQKLKIPAEDLHQKKLNELKKRREIVESRRKR